MDTSKTPLVSIVTISYNQAQFLESTILSVLEQDYPNIEYVVVDGGSTDGSVEIIRRYADRLAWWVSERDRGQTEAINKGFAHAHGSIHAWLNSDDTYLPHAIAEAVDYLQTHPEVGMVYGDSDYIDEQGRVIGRFRAAQTDRRRLLQGYVHIPQQSSFWRGDLWRQVGPLDPSFNYAMDYDLWVRFTNVGARLVYTPQLWSNFRIHLEGKTVATTNGCWPEMMKVYRRNGGTWLGVLPALYVLRRLGAPLHNLWIRRRFNVPR
jgi:glycosyltransferase involved in cell wall biosynthesis